MAIITACSSSKKVFLEKKSQEFASQPIPKENLLTEPEINHLPV